MITLIWAMDRNRLIGDHDRLPWPRIAADMQWFRRHTMEKTIVMGRATFDSIGQRPLPHRRNIVLSRQQTPPALKHVEWVQDIDHIHQLAASEEVMIIGGAQLYAQLLDAAEHLIYTEIDAAFEGNTRFPPFDPHQWHTDLRQHHPQDDNSPFPLTFVQASRIQK
ncbi:MAG: dihydrofolate reductase [Mariprofundales bacterium]